MAESVELTFLGCGDAFGSGGRLNTCFHVDAGSTRFLIDCGATSLIALHRNGLTTDDIDAILVTHFHGDHYGGLPFLFLDAAMQRKRERPLDIVAPEGGAERTRQLMELLYPGMSSTMDRLDLRFHCCDSCQTVDLGSLNVTAYPVIHSDEARSHGLRIEVADRIIGFSGDTTWTDELRNIAAGAHLMICECNFFETQTPNHLDYRTLEQRLPELNADRIILNHLGNEMLRNLDRISVTCAEDGMKVRV